MSAIRSFCHSLRAGAIKVFYCKAEADGGGIDQIDVAQLFFDAGKYVLATEVVYQDRKQSL